MHLSALDRVQNFRVIACAQMLHKRLFPSERKPFEYCGFRMEIGIIVCPDQSLPPLVESPRTSHPYLGVAVLTDSGRHGVWGRGTGAGAQHWTSGT